MLDRWQSFGVESSNVCNANCSFCGYGKNIDRREKGFVSFETLRRILDMYSKEGGGNMVFDSIFGDPLTDKDLLGKIRLIRSYPSIKGISIYTNLIGLASFDVDEFLKCGLTNIAVSTALGSRDTYKRLYGAELYEKVVGNILALLKTNQRLGSPADIKLLVRTDYDLLPALSDMAEVKEINKYLKKKNFRVLGMREWDDYNGAVKISDLPNGARFKTNVTDKSIPCYGLYRKLQILKDGDIAMCSCRIAPELVVDNIFNYNSLSEYWRGDKLNERRKKWFEGEIPSICRGCTHYMPYTALANGAIRNKIYKNIKKIFATGGKWFS